MDNYVINSNTLFLMPFGDKQTKVLEKERELILDGNPNRLINKNCKYFGSSMANRQKWTESITGDVYKVPISIREDGSLIVFPTSSPRLKKVGWLVLNNIKKIYFDRDNKVTIVEFSNKRCEIIDVSKNILNNQLLKATRLEYILNKNRI